jgi:mono/diheme cytochrome c family protein
MEGDNKKKEVRTFKYFLMKHFLVITGCIAAVVLVSCGKARRNTGRAYMPDMAYSRAYETYAPAQERLSASGAHFTGRPVEGTIARGDMMHYALKNDSAGYSQSASLTNPLDVATIDMKESERLYLVNCAICHGSKLDGNGPLYNNGNGPFAAAPKNLTEAMPEGRMFHSVTYGKGQMGSYASQLTTKQRWMVIAYVKSQQGGAAPDSLGAAKKDSAATAMPK